VSKSQTLQRSTPDYECEDTWELNTGVAPECLPITGIHTRVATKSKYTDYRPLFTTQDEWTIVRYVMDVLRPFRYWTLWMSKRHTVTLHHVITVYNDLFDHIDGMM